jgi:hypothetical protein
MPQKQLSGEDFVVVLFSLLGLLGSAALYSLRFPSIMISIFLSAGITAVVYRFLGGTQGATFVVGALKLGGTAAVLIGVAWWIDSTRELAPQQVFRLASQQAMVGKWNWKAVGPNTGWDGQLEFALSNGQLTFTGQEYILEAGPGGGVEHKPFLEMTGGKAELTSDGTSLMLDSDAREFQYGRTFHWKSEEPLVLIPAFAGKLWPKRSGDTNLESQPWGILITKDAAR